MHPPLICCSTRERPVGGGKEPKCVRLKKHVITTMNIFKSTVIIMASAKDFRWTDDEVIASTSNPEL